MPISFSCGQCGKGYLVSDGLAGKKAVCKACNHRMTIPGAPDPARPAAAPEPVPLARAVARKAKPAVEDLYGLDDAPAPLPPMMPRTAYTEATVAEAPVKKKKKKGGFFSGGKKKASTSSSSFSGGGMGGLRVVGILVGIGAAAVGGWGLMSKSELQTVLTQLVAQINQAAATIEGLRDMGMAMSAAPKVQAELQAILDTLEKNKNRKGRKQDIEAMNRQFESQIMTAFARLRLAMDHATRIGARGPLGIDPFMMRLTTVLDELAKNG